MKPKFEKTPLLKVFRGTIETETVPTNCFGLKYNKKTPGINAIECATICISIIRSFVNMAPSELQEGIEHIILTEITNNLCDADSKNHTKILKLKKDGAIDSEI